MQPVLAHCYKVLSKLLKEKYSDAVSTQTLGQLIKCSDSQKGASRQTAQLDLGISLSNKKTIYFYFATFKTFDKHLDVGVTRTLQIFQILSALQNSKQS